MEMSDAYRNEMGKINHVCIDDHLIDGMVAGLG